MAAKQGAIAAAYCVRLEAPWRMYRPGSELFGTALRRRIIPVKRHFPWFGTSEFELSTRITVVAAWLASAGMQRTEGRNAGFSLKWRGAITVRTQNTGATPFLWMDPPERGVTKPRTIKYKRKSGAVACTRQTTSQLQKDKQSCTRHKKWRGELL